MQRALSAVFVVLLASAPLRGAEVPRLTGPVNDYAEVLSPDDEKRLTGFLLGQERKTTNQIVILTVKSLDGDTIEDFAVKVFNTWKLGQKGKDNGVLVVLATGERKIRIEVGFGLEGAIPDAVASRIIRDAMAPKFKAKDFAGGFMEAAIAIDKAVAGEFQAENRKEDDGLLIGIILLIIFLVFGVGGLLLFLIIKAGGLRGGGSSGGWSSGGGSSGGGGDYSGGGGGSGGGGASGGY